uniref:Charged multivesicular body protein 4b-like n=1 Tax=Ciona intestinalis TaxID=7719 RepID=A0A1W2WA63_CIOIN|nr:charged multivesicular body protein 4b-like isoform X2 [Ciona intestinalis]XP_009858985.1 charged multivesicular body protein 4b-like isoform X1 [Ciona intestinalis]|eukprot:XP_002125355.1 charged multivesicular body protein 4b-like isoform X2 [Ciona intestinalis]
MFKNMFGGGSKGKEKVSSQEAIQKLRDTAEMLQKKSEHLEVKIERELKTAKQHGTKNKKMAIAALKRKKRFEKQLQNVDGTLSTVELQLEAVQNAESNKLVLDTMKTGAQALKQAHNHMNADEVHDVMDEIDEQKVISDEITTALSGGFGYQDVDEDDLMAELEELEQEEFNENMLDIPAAEELPDVPTHSLPQPAKAKAKAKEDDDELAELQMWAS